MQKVVKSLSVVPVSAHGRFQGCFFFLHFVSEGVTAVRKEQAKDIKHTEKEEKGKDKM